MERLDHLRRKAALVGLKTEPNVSVPLLEQALGIKFTDPPVQVSLGSRRNQFLSLRYPVTFLTQKWVNDASYHHGLNIFFLPDDNPEPSYLSLHESMHGWLNQNSKDPIDVKIFLAGVVLGFPEEIWQHLVSAKIVSEGLPEWAAAKTAQTFGIDDNRAAALHKLNLSKVRANLKNLPSFSGRMFSDEGLGFFECVLDATYTAGFGFVDEAVEEFQRGGLSVASALEFIAREQPINLQEIVDPQTYLARISARI